MPGGRGQGGGSSAGMALALGLLAVAAGAGAMVVQDQISSRNQRRRQEQAEKRRAELEAGRAATLSNEACHDHRYRGPARQPRLLNSIDIDAIPLGLPINVMANMMGFLDVSACFSFRSVSTSWNRFLRDLFRYKPYIKQVVWRGDFHNDLRVRYWIAVLDGKDRLAQSAHLYCQLVNVGEDPFDSDATVARIRRDISRTMPEVEIFRSGSKSESLYRLLCCYALADRQVGYCQGMNYVAAYLLTLEIETKAFAFFDILMQDYQYRWIFAPGLPHLRLCLFQLDRLLAMFLPSLHLHLAEESVAGELYASEWFISLFTYSFAVCDVGRIWDLFLIFGWKSLIKVALAILSCAESQLLNMRFEMIIQAVKHRPSTLLCGDVEKILSRASQFKVTNSLLQALEDQYWLENNS